MYLMTEYYLAELIEIIPVHEGGGTIKDVYMNGYPVNKDIKTRLIYICRVIKNLVNDNRICHKGVFYIEDSKRNNIIHIERDSIECTFSKYKYWKNYVECVGQHKMNENETYQLYKFKF